MVAEGLGVVEQKSGGPMAQPACQVGHSKGWSTLPFSPTLVGRAVVKCTVFSCFEIPILLVDHRNPQGRGQALLGEDDGCKPQSPTW